MAEASIRSNLAGHQIRSAALFARRVAAIEREHRTLSDDCFIEHRASTLASVILAATAADALINELFLDAHDRIQHTFEGACPDVPTNLAQTWSRSFERKPTLEKYQTALSLANVRLFENESALKNIAGLVVLRHSLVHFTPEWGTALDKHAKIENLLRGRFSEAPYYGRGDAFFPKRCLGHGCAAWSVRTVVSFVSEFCGRLGIRDRFDPCRPHLGTG